MSFIRTLRSVVRLRGFSFDRTGQRLSRAADISDLRRLAKKRLPQGVFDYFDGGADDEESLRRSTSGLRALQFRPRVLVDVSKINTEVTLLGTTMSIPYILGVTGFSRIAHSQGELAVARSAERAGLIYTIGTLGTRSVEEVAAVSSGPKWFQLYVWRDRGLSQHTVERAAAAGFTTLVVTVDTPVLGRRNRDVRRGFTLPPKIGPATIIDGIRHPRWTLDFLRGGEITFENIRGQSEHDGSTAVTLADMVNSLFDPSLSWADLEWIRSIWNGPMVLKGIQSVDDALRAADAGMDAIALSNHGGRQLDDAPTIIDLVAPVTDALSGRIPVICDGGIRRGSDIVKAMALGATACMGGRGYLFGLGAAGERGVDHALSLMSAELRRTMALVGCSDVTQLDRSYLALDK